MTPRPVPVVLAVLLVVAGVVAVGHARTPRKPKPHGGAVAAYWHAHANVNAALHREGVLGARVRSLTAENRRLRRQAAARTLQAVGSSQIERNFLCIQGGEAPWDGTDNATHKTYFGGLQMDLQFQRTYGPEFLAAWGTANFWPRSVQIAVAIRAYLSGRRYGPWPTTSRACGLN